MTTVCSTRRKDFPVLSSCITRLTRRVSLVEQELLTFLEHLISPPAFSEVRLTRSLVLYVLFVDCCLSFAAFSCVVCSSIYGFWLPLWYLQTLPSITFCHRKCCSETKRSPVLKFKWYFLTLSEHLSSPLVFSGVRVNRSLVLCVCFVDRCLSFCSFSFGHCVSVLLRYTDSDYLPLVSSNSSYISVSWKTNVSA